MFPESVGLLAFPQSCAVGEAICRLLKASNAVGDRRVCGEQGGKPG
jgi:hypothetical protein